MVWQFFRDLPVAPAIAKALDVRGFVTPTEIQKLALPVMLDGRDLLAQSKTGSGKTVAFGVALLNFLLAKYDVSAEFALPRALVLCPTRELAEQVAAAIRQLGLFIPNLRVVVLTGGTIADQQRERLQSGAHIVVGTPGRIMDLMQKNDIGFLQADILVLDEVDRMLDMGFVPSIDWILGFLPKRRQTWLFSATIPEAIREMSQKYQVAPVSVTAETMLPDSVIEELFIEIEPRRRAEAIEGMVKRNRYESVLVFCATKAVCNALAADLFQRGLYAQVLHGDLDQRSRTEVLARFANKSCTVLVATDVASRGLDIKDLEVVVNYDLSPDPEVHVHRIGRTGRMGKRGSVFNFISQLPEAVSNSAERAERAGQVALRLEALSAFMQRPLEKMSYEAFLQKDSNGRENLLERVVPPMVTVFLGGGRKTKIRKGDILGALTGEAGIDALHIGVINIFDSFSFVALRRDKLKEYMATLKGLKVKGTRLKVQVLDDNVVKMLD